MGDLTKVPHVLDSREVAEMVGMRHADLMRNIDHYIEIMGQNAKLRSDDFFIKQTYTAGTGKQYKRYDITKKGCEMVANKLTGEKGILFTALNMSSASTIWSGTTTSNRSSRPSRTRRERCEPKQCSATQSPSRRK